MLYKCFYWIIFWINVHICTCFIYIGMFIFFMEFVCTCKKWIYTNKPPKHKSVKCNIVTWSVLWNYISESYGIKINENGTQNDFIHIFFHVQFNPNFQSFLFLRRWRQQQQQQSKWRNVNLNKVIQFNYKIVRVRIK